ncbi:hypothetical protein D8674_034153 [Pyrus ussuriensis x Pyrus communis]|uniref:Uncharacterized protein n=1 Tax=Pyrus ussuriensis x Pyrus communis TaxID=2448454 RepID=A0A5N5HP46_9ROSA|nr:hypothetical protein D8674_034153 [Pyrus ussuriensis x Pyrus communis]
MDTYSWNIVPPAILPSHKHKGTFAAREKVPPGPGNDDGTDDFYDAEILDEMTRSRGELKLRTSFSSED